MKKLCSTCRWFAALPAPDDNLGTCRGALPVVLQDHSTVWPKVLRGDFCAEWKELNLGGQAGRPFIIKEADLISLLDDALPLGTDGKTLAQITRWLAAKGTEMSPSALYARLTRLVDLHVLEKEDTVYTFVRADAGVPIPAPTVEVD